MQTLQSTYRPRPICIAILLAIAMVFAQWAGLQHGVRHAGLQHDLAPAVQIELDTGDAHHSCIAFDAAALADSICFPPSLAPLLTGVATLSLWNAFASWDVPFALYFSSRAPPLP